MNFRRNRHREEPEINFIPLIDLLLVILIFLMVTTSYTRYAELELNLPSAEGQSEAPKQAPLQAAVTADGRYALSGQLLAATDLASLSQQLRTLAQGQKQAVLIINADAKASHQSVVLLMEAAREAGILRVTFATKKAAG